MRGMGGKNDFVYHSEGHPLYLDGMLILDLADPDAIYPAKLYAILIERKDPALAAAIRERLRVLKAIRAEGETA